MLQILFVALDGRGRDWRSAAVDPHLALGGRCVTGGQLLGILQLGLGVRGAAGGLLMRLLLLNPDSDVTCHLL